MCHNDQTKQTQKTPTETKIHVSIAITSPSPPPPPHALKTPHSNTSLRSLPLTPPQPPPPSRSSTAQAAYPAPSSSSPPHPPPPNLSLLLAKSPPHSPGYLEHYTQRCEKWRGCAAPRWRRKRCNRCKRWCKRRGWGGCSVPLYFPVGLGCILRSGGGGSGILGDLRVALSSGRGLAWIYRCGIVGGFFVGYERVGC